MGWVFVCFGTILAVEVFLRTNFKVNINTILRLSKRSSATIRSAKISDHWKEKALIQYALRIFVHSLQLLLWLTLTVLAIMVVHLLGTLFNIDVLSLLKTSLGLIVSLLVASLYIFFRAKVFHV